MGDYRIVKKMFEIEGRLDNFKLKKKVHITEKRYLSSPKMTPLMRRARKIFEAKSAPYGYSESSGSCGK